jgi:ABC-type polysaccharide/polyol phosphate transport system ATPase subunit
MSNIAIRIDHISKRYKIGKREKYHAFRDVLTEAMKAPLRLLQGRNGNSREQTSESFWALKDICMDVEQGEIVGLIGRNGAGKTTLLKILTRITRPTSGRAHVNGRVGSLLEVGTGFHTELTGRENVYFYGSILGMRKREIEQKFDEIVDFSGVDKFLDTPLKHYSSGMQSRLAFAIAAHLEPEVLLVDEVLAVGDLEFQKKCLGRMEKVSQGGRTVVLVSHQLSQIRRLCKKVVWLDKGQIRQAGPALEVTGAYEAALLSREHGGRNQPGASVGKARCVRWELGEPHDGNPHVLKSLGPAKVKFTVEINAPLTMVHTAISIRSADNQLLWGTGYNIDSLEPGIFEFVFDLAVVPLKMGAYRWRFHLADEFETLEYWDCSPDLLIDTEPLGHLDEQWAGLLNVPSEFAIYDQTGNPSKVRAVRGRMWTSLRFR